MSTSPPIQFREVVHPSDMNAVRRIVTKTQRFSPAEVDVAVELVQERLQHGPEYGYHFVIAERADAVCGYACFGPIPCTEGSYDLYWIAVDPAFQGRGLGRRLMEAAEALIRHAGGRRIFIDTSSRADYEPTRRFYECCGYTRAAQLADFYHEGDDKLIYAKRLTE